MQTWAEWSKRKARKVRMLDICVEKAVGHPSTKAEGIQTYWVHDRVKPWKLIKGHWEASSRYTFNYSEIGGAQENNTSTLKV